MPLPVERSQGSVSALVARFQTAANRDAEQGRRMSLPPPSSSRRNSSLGVSPNNTGGRDTTVTHSQVTSEPTVPAPGHVNEPVADLVEKEVKETQGKDTVEPIVEDTEAENGQSDQVLEDTPVRGDKTSSPAPVENHTGNDATSSSSISPVKVTDKAEHESKEEVEDISAEPIEAKEPAAQKTPSKSRLSSQPSPLKVAETPTPLKKGTKLVPKVAGTPNKHKQSISAAAKVAKDSTPASSKTKPSQPSSPTTTTSLRKSVRSAKTDPAPLTPTKSESSKPSKAGATLHQSATTPVNNATSSASITILPRSTKKALARPSTSQGALSTPKAKTATSDAIPPMPAESKSPEDSLTPLRPQLTGHTASSLAKTRTPVAQKTMRAQTSMSLGRASGSRARPRPSSPTPAGGERSGHGKMSSSSSTSRLMQGTAASRARAADSPSLKAKTWSRSGTVKDLKKASETGTLGRAKTSQQKDESTGTAIVHSKTTVTGRPETSRLTSNEEKTNLATRGNGQGTDRKSRQSQHRYQKNLNPSITTMTPQQTRQLEAQKYRQHQARRQKIHAKLQEELNGEESSSMTKPKGKKSGRWSKQARRTWKRLVRGLMSV